MPIDGPTLKRFRNPVFVETGTFRGDGINAAIDAGFAKICSIELSPDLHAKARARHSVGRRVNLVCGSSADELPRLIADMDTPITFWLDAHGYEGCGEGDHPCPLLAELDAIAAHPLHDSHVVLIDDFHVIGRAFRADISEEAIRERLSRINPNGFVFRMDSPRNQWDIMGMMPWI